MRKTTVVIDEKLRAAVAKFLPEALARAITFYEKRMTECETAGVDRFAELYQALQRAAAHIELLLKLALRVGLPVAKSNDAGILAAMVEEAKVQLASYRSLPAIEADWVEETVE